MTQIRQSLWIIAIILTSAVFLTLLSGLSYHLLGIPPSGIIKTLSYFIQAYCLPALGIILFFIVTIHKKNDRN